MVQFRWDKKYQKGAVIMRFIFKIIAIPFVIALTILNAILTFLFVIAQEILNFASGLSILIAIILMAFLHNWVGGAVFFGIAFLISPVGIPAIADWLIGKLTCANYALRDFITG